MWVIMGKKTYADDDGRVIAKMNIEGTPWYVNESHTREASSTKESAASMKETFHIIKGALAAGLLIGLVFIFAFFIFILFCTQIWFK